MAFCTVFNKSDSHYERDHVVRISFRQFLSLADLSRFLIFLAFASSVSWLVRYRYLTMYARLPPEPQRKEPPIDLFPEPPESSKRHMSNYLDEFLSAIKVFGYLERPVFHELTRTMQTKKLIAGETISLEEEDGFCLVVDGLVQIFVKSNRERPNKFESMPEEDDDENGGGANQGYQLLTEVKNGAPMSSLFSILSLFTEDVKLRYDQDEDDGLTATNAPYNDPSMNVSASSIGGAVTPRSGEASPDFTPLGSPRHRAAERRSSSINPAASRRLPTIPPLSLNTGNSEARERVHRHASNDVQKNRKTKRSAHPDIVARATVDTTIAIIPATAFRRLTRVYPRASAHVVQVILTRLQRVTLTTGHAYLGLTGEVLRTEKLMNKYTTYDLPGFLKDSALERLKEKFNKVSHTKKFVRSGS